jgi:hypothetical protein
LYLAVMHLELYTALGTIALPLGQTLEAESMKS